MKGILATSVSVVLALIGVAATCGSDGADPRLEEYLRSLEELSSDNGESDALETRLQEQMLSGDSLEERVAAGREYFTLALAQIEEATADLRGLDPPPEAAAAHDEQVSGMEGVVASTEQLIADLDHATSETELEALIFGYVESFEPLRPSCRELEKIASDNGIDVELRCELAENQ